MNETFKFTKLDDLFKFLEQENKNTTYVTLEEKCCQNIKYQMNDGKIVAKKNVKFYEIKIVS